MDKWARAYTSLHPAMNQLCETSGGLGLVIKHLRGTCVLYVLAGDLALQTDG